MSLGMERLFVNTMRYTNSFTPEPETTSEYTFGEKFAAKFGGNLIAVPLELLSSAENLLLKLPVRILSTGLKLTLYTASFTCRVLFMKGLSNALLRKADQLPGLSSVLFTAYKVVAFVLGAACTATIGLFISTRVNFYIHDKLYLLDPTLDCPFLRTNKYQEGIIKEKELILGDRNRTIRQLNSQVTDLDTTLAQLRSTLRTKEGSISQMESEKTRLHTHIRTKENEIAGLKQEISNLQSRTNLLVAAQAGKEKLEGLLVQNKATIADLQKQNQTLIEELKERKDYLGKVLAADVEAITTLQNQNQALIAELQNAKVEVEKTKEKIASLETDVNQVSQGSDRLEAAAVKIQQLEEKIAQLYREMEVLKMANPSLDAVVEQKDEEIKKLIEEIGSLRQQIDSFVDIEERYKTENKNALAKLEELRNQVLELSSSSEEEVSENNDSEVELQKLRGKFTHLKDSHKIKTAEVGRLQKEVEEIEGLRQHITTLQNTNAALLADQQKALAENNQRLDEQAEEQRETLRAKDLEIAQLKKATEDQAHLEQLLAERDGDLNHLRAKYNELAAQKGQTYNMTTAADVAMLHRSNTN